MLRRNGKLVMQKTGAGKPWDTMQRQKKNNITVALCNILIFTTKISRIVQYFPFNTESRKLPRAQWPKNPGPLPIVRSLAGKLLLPGDLHEWEGLASDGGLVYKQTGCCSCYGCLGSFVTKDCDLGCSWHFFRRKTEKPNTSGGLTMVVQLCL